MYFGSMNYTSVQPDQSLPYAWRSLVRSIEGEMGPQINVHAPIRLRRCISVA